jgi:hypothetical protein
LVWEDIERMGTKLEIYGTQTQGHWLSLLDIEPVANNSEIYRIEYLQNMRAQIEPPH